MGWILLVLGLALWWMAHLLKRLAPSLRVRMGDQAKGRVALAILVSVMFMVLGYRLAPASQLWQHPGGLVYLNNLLAVIAVWMMTPAPKWGRVLNSVRHPMLGGFMLWSFAHVIVNGDTASLVLFGGLFAWAAVEIVVINRAEPGWTPRPAGHVKYDAIMLAASVVIVVLIGLVHQWLGVPVFST